MPRRIRILVLAANPTDTTRLRLDEEVREIQDGIQRSSRRSKFEVLQQWAVRPRDIRRALLDFSPDIVHFCGHGAGAEGLVFENDHGETTLVSTDAITALFELFSDSLKCVLLNACYSETQARTIAAHVPFVVGMSRNVGDKAAIEFAVGFYDALAAGKPVDMAFRFGCNAIQLAGIDEHCIPTLIAGAAVDCKREPRRQGQPAAVHGLATRGFGGLSAVTLKELISAGRDVDDVIRSLLRLDYESIGSLDGIGAGNLEQWRPVVLNNPDGFAFVLNGNREIVGYWHFAALQEDLLARALAGTMEDGEITVDQTRFLCVPGLYDIYFIATVVDAQHRGYKTNRLLLDAFLTRLEEFASSDILVRSISANAYTAEGVGLCRSIGMKLLRAHKRHGQIYHLSMLEAAALLRNRPRLFQRTLDALAGNTKPTIEP